MCVGFFQKTYILCLTFEESFLAEGSRGRSLPESGPCRFIWKSPSGNSPVHCQELSPVGRGGRRWRVGPVRPGWGAVTQTQSGSLYSCLREHLKEIYCSDLGSIIQLYYGSSIENQANTSAGHRNYCLLTIVYLRCPQTFGIPKAVYLSLGAVLNKSKFLFPAF